MSQSSVAVPGTGGRRALGTDPDLEKLARQVRRAGGSVEIVTGNHIQWTMPDGTTMRTGLTMSRTNVRAKRLRIARMLQASQRQAKS